jgi:hypothetical protein
MCSDDACHRRIAARQCAARLYSMVAEQRPLLASPRRPGRAVLEHDAVGRERCTDAIGLGKIRTLAAPRSATPLVPRRQPNRRRAEIRGRAR